MFLNAFIGLGILDGGLFIGLSLGEEFDFSLAGEVPCLSLLFSYAKALIFCSYLSMRWATSDVMALMKFFTLFLYSAKADSASVIL
jgi:hypothetical protein